MMAISKASASPRVRTSAGSQAYLKLAREVVLRERKRRAQLLEVS